MLYPSVLGDIVFWGALTQGCPRFSLLLADPILHFPDWHPILNSQVQFNLRRRGAILPAGEPDICAMDPAAIIRFSYLPSYLLRYLLRYLLLIVS